VCSTLTRFVLLALCPIQQPVIRKFKKYVSKSNGGIDLVDEDSQQILFAGRSKPVAFSTIARILRDLNK